MTADTDPVPSLREWAFAAYDRPGVQEACLELQDRHGMDVVALLWCIWAGEHHGVIDAGAVERIVAETAAWQTEVVAPLRAVRRRLKHADASVAATGRQADADADRAARDRLRSQVADAELAAEVIQLDRLEASTLTASAVGEAPAPSAVAGHPGEAAMRANMAALVSAGGLDSDPARAVAIEALLATVAGVGS
ncbi:MAG: TIGR02444 family protein [Acidimicrobiales bacterium]